MAYTSVELLVAGCGEQQPWIAAPVEKLESLRGIVEFDVIALDVQMPEDMRVGADGRAASGPGVIE